MSGETAGLLEFVQGVDWSKYKGDSDVLDILGKIKKRVEALENEGDEAECPRAKLVVVGDGAVGKTCLLITFKSGEFPETYVPTVFENHTVDTEYNNAPFMLQLWDTAGQEDYDRLRPLSYPGTEVVLLCFSLVNEATFEAIREKWNPEINHYLDNVPKILVGTKLDLRDEGKADPAVGRVERITTKQGKELAEEIEAVAYIETSARTRQNLKLLFQEAIKAAVSSREEDEEPKKKKTSSKDKKKSSKSRDKSSSKSGDKKEERKKSSSKVKDETGEKKDGHRKRSKTKEAGAEAEGSKTKDDGEKKERKHKSSRSKSKKEGEPADGEKKERRHKSSRSKKEGDGKDEKKKSSSSSSSKKKESKA